MNESTIPDNEFLFNKVKDLESMATPDPVFHEGTGETHFGGGGLTLGSTVCFGYELDPDGDNTAEVLVYSGEGHHGVRAIVDVVDTKKELTEDHQYVWFETVLGSGTAIVAGPSTSRPVSTSADSTFREWLYLFRLVDGVASLERVGNFGNVTIPGAFA